MKLEPVYISKTASSIALKLSLKKSQRGVL